MNTTTTKERLAAITRCSRRQAGATPSQGPGSPPGWRQFEHVQTIMEGDSNLRGYLGEPTHEVQGEDGEIAKYSSAAVKVAQACFEQHVDVASLSIPDVIVFASQMRNCFGREVTNSQPTGATGTSAAKHSAEVNGDSEAEQDQKTTGIESSAIQSRGPAENDTGVEEIEIAHGAAKGVYVVHPVACMFPMIQGQGYDELVRSLKSDGQQEDCVVDGNMLLDGRNRVNALNQLGREVRVVQFAELSTGLSAADWIMVKNLQRRHLTDDQQLSIAAKYLAWRKAEAERQRAEGGTAQTAQRETSAAGQARDAAGASDTEFPLKAAENTSKRKRGRPRGSRSEAEALARQTKQSQHRARQMVKLRKEAPELATAVEQDEMSLKEAMRELKRRESNSDRVRDRDDADGMVKAVEKARGLLSKLASKFDAAEQITFWQQVASFVSSQPGAENAAR